MLQHKNSLLFVSKIPPVVNFSLHSKISGPLMLLLCLSSVFLLYLGNIVQLSAASRDATYRLAYYSQPLHVRRFVCD